MNAVFPSLAALLAIGAAPPTQVTPVADGVRDGRAVAMHVGGRVVADPTPLAQVRRQWPGTYFEAAFRGPAIDFLVGPGDVSLRIVVDGADPIALVKPAPGRYRAAATGAGPHRVRIDVVSESQDGATTFGGFVAPAGGDPLPPPRPRARQIEFVGDSHTVGYGNTSATRECTQAQVWATTDTSQGIAGRIGRRYDADYQVNAISGRGIVRNYDGFAADTVPKAYPYTLFDRAQPYRDPAWRPQAIVIALGTNDFSTPLKRGERWPTRAALHADYERTYVDFVHRLRRRNPGAYFVLWATDLSGGEIAREVTRVVARLHREGEQRVTFVPVDGLRFGGCHAHPDLADDARIAAAIGNAIDAAAVWTPRR